MINWSGYNWLTHERWGRIHEKKTYCWYDDFAVKINKQNQLILKTQYHPRYFPHLKVTSKIGVGLISNLTPFKHGCFEIEAKLPKGKHLWPAFWMWSFEDWPPEIDIFEGYTKRTNNYFTFDLRNPIGFWNINTNVHLGKTPNNYNLGAKTHWMGFKDPTKNFIKYKCIWTPYTLNFYYNERKVRSITNKKYLDQLNSTTMNLIINNSVDKGVNEDDPPHSQFIVNYFKYDSY